MRFENPERLSVPETFDWQELQEDIASGRQIRTRLMAIDHELQQMTRPLTHFADELIGHGNTGSPLVKVRDSNEHPRSLYLQAVRPEPHAFGASGYKFIAYMGAQVDRSKVDAIVLAQSHARLVGQDIEGKDIFGGEWGRETLEPTVLQARFRTKPATLEEIEIQFSKSVEELGEIKDTVGQASLCLIDPDLNPGAAQRYPVLVQSIIKQEIDTVPALRANR